MQIMKWRFFRAETKNKNNEIFDLSYKILAYKKMHGHDERTNRGSIEAIVDGFNHVVPNFSFDASAGEYQFSNLDPSLKLPLLDSKDFLEENRLSSTGDYVHVENSPSLTIFLLINTMIGSGILNQPFVFRQAGVLGGIVGYILASAMTWLGLNLLTASGLKVKIYEYGALTKFALGRKGEILIDISIIIGCFGSLLGYILVVGSTLSALLGTWGCESEACGIYLTTIISVTLFVTPICLLRHFGHLAFLSIFSVFAIVCVLLLVIIGGPILANPGKIVVFDALGTVN